MAIVFPPQLLRMHYTNLSVHTPLPCKPDFVNISPVFNILGEKSEPSVCAGAPEVHEPFIGEIRETTSQSGDMNCNWQSEAVVLPSAVLESNSLEDNVDEDSISNSETHSDSASLPYQYLIERDIERERKNMRIAELALLRKNVATTSASGFEVEGDTRATDVCQLNGSVETTVMSMSTDDDYQLETFEKSIEEDCPEIVGNPVSHSMFVQDNDKDIDFPMGEEEEDIVPEALVNSMFFEDTFQVKGNAFSTGHFEDLLMDDMEPNDEKIVRENGLTNIITASSSNGFTMNKGSVVKGSIKFPKIISNEIITSDQMSPALLKVLNKPPVETNSVEINISNKVEDFSRLNNQSNLKSKNNDKESCARTKIRNDIKSKVNNISKDNMRVTRSNGKLFTNSNQILSTSTRISTKETNFKMTWRRKASTNTYDDQLINEDAKSENQCINRNSNDVSKNCNYDGIEGTLNKRIKINTHKLINDLTYGIKIVVERLDFPSIPR